MTELDEDERKELSDSLDKPGRLATLSQVHGKQ